MKRSFTSWLLAISQRLYGLLLYLYPASFRATYGHEILQLFSDCCRDAITTRGTLGLLGFWLRTVGDLVVSVVREWVAAAKQPRLAPQLVTAGRRSRVQGSFDGFTHRAHASLRFATEEAAALGHAQVGPEHLLLGFLREEGGVAALALKEHGMDLQRARDAVWFLWAPRGQLERPKTPLAESIRTRTEVTPQLVAVCDAAAEEARTLNHPYIGTEHLLLGLLRCGNGSASGILEMLAVRQEDVRDYVIRIAQAPTSPETPGDTA